MAIIVKCDTHTMQSNFFGRLFRIECHAIIAYFVMNKGDKNLLNNKHYLLTVFKNLKF